MTHPTNATLKALEKTGVTWKSAQGSNYWLFGEDTLHPIREAREDA